MNKIPILAANWKMHKTAQETTDFIAQFTQFELPKRPEYIIAASPILLYDLGKNCANTPIQPAAQNMFYEEQGAFTAETSPLQLKDAGIAHVIIGHSERRHMFNEDNALLNKKMHTAQNQSITAIYCVGETLDERQNGKAQAVVEQQLTEGLAGLSPETLKSTIIAYEPVWAIGTGETATPEQAEEMHAYIATLVPEETRILYGGSVKPENAEELFAKPSIDGFLVGGASLEPKSFFEIAITLK